MEAQKTFKIESAAGASDKERQGILEDNIARYAQAVHEATKQYSNIDLARKRAGQIRHKAINGLEKYLIEFEASFERNGGKVIWAQDSVEALKQILGLLKKNGVSQVIKSKSLITDEIGLPEELKKENIEYIETDPGEFILRQFNEKPRHAISMIMHKSKHEITEVLKLNYNIPAKFNSADILNFIRTILRPKFMDCKVSISGANYLIADTGSVCISENTGDAAINSSIPKVQIILAGIDKVIPSIMNLDVLLPLYATFSTGDRINAFNTILSGPRQEGESDGPIEMYVVLIDNGRSEVLRHKYQRRALSCIDCGACHNACPVYKTIGGKAYGTTYTGPIGSIITPWMKGIEEYNHLSYASTLCAKCTDVCPVNINLHELLLYNRNDSIKLRNFTLTEGWTMDGWHQALKSRKRMDWLSPKWKNFFISKVYSSRWGSKKSMPQISQKSFKQLWEERREGKN